MDGTASDTLATISLCRGVTTDGVFSCSPIAGAQNIRPVAAVRRSQELFLVSTFSETGTCQGSPGIVG